MDEGSRQEPTEPAARGESARRFDPFLVAVLAIGCALVFLGLDEIALWTDEAEAAWLGRSILDHGVPTAFDGRNYLTQWVVAKREDFNDDLVWVLSPWLQLYMCAGSFALFGVSTFTARLPFAIVGVACIWMLYRLARRATGDVRVARVASLLLVSCIPFLLHVRQARYYSVAMFVSMWAVDAYAGVMERRRWAPTQLVVAIALLFHSNYGLCVPFVGALALHALFYGWGKIRLWQLAVVPLAVAALTLPWAYYAQITRTASRLDLSPYFFNLYHYLAAVNRWAMPFLWLALFLALRPFGWKSPWLGIKNVRVTAALVCGLVGVFFVSINVGLFTRYIINVMPLFVLLTACFVVWFVDGVRARGGRAAALAAWGVVPLSMLTTVPGMPFAPLLVAGADGSWRKPVQDNAAVRRPLEEFTGPRHEIFDFLEEITGEYDGPLEGVADFLARNADPDHVVFTDYGDLPLLFYTDNLIRGGLQGRPYTGNPEWIVRRTTGGGAFSTSLAVEKGYIAIELSDHPDTRWENRPDPFVHMYRVPKIDRVLRPKRETYFPVVVYMRADLELRDRSGVKVFR